MADRDAVHDENYWLPAGTDKPLLREDMGSEDVEPEGTKWPWTAEAQFVVGFGVQVHVASLIHPTTPLPTAGCLT